MPAIGDKMLYKGIKCTVAEIKPNGEIECVSEDGLLRVISEPSEFQSELTPFTVENDRTPSPEPVEEATPITESLSANGQEQSAAPVEQLAPASEAPTAEEPALPTPIETPAPEAPVDPAPPVGE